MNQNELADRNTFGTGEIRQLQMLTVLFSCLSPDSKLRELFEYALALPHEAWLSRITPPNDMSYNGLKTWLEGLWVHKELNSDEQKLVTWQSSAENMIAAVNELKAIEQVTGLRLNIAAFSPLHERGLTSVVSQ